MANVWFSGIQEVISKGMLTKASGERTHGAGKVGLYVWELYVNCRVYANFEYPNWYSESVQECRDISSWQHVFCGWYGTSD
jgi:hypothetical protein